MIIPVEGRQEGELTQCAASWGQPEKDGGPGVHLIDDPTVALAVSKVSTQSNLFFAHQELATLLGDEYFVYLGGTHVAIHKKINGVTHPQRLCMLVDSNDKDARHQFHSLAAFS